VTSEEVTSLYNNGGTLNIKFRPLDASLSTKTSSYYIWWMSLAAPAGVVGGRTFFKLLLRGTADKLGVQLTYSSSTTHTPLVGWTNNSSWGAISGAELAFTLRFAPSGSKVFVDSYTWNGTSTNTCAALTEFTPPAGWSTGDLVSSIRGAISLDFITTNLATVLGASIYNVDLKINSKSYNISPTYNIPSIDADYSLLIPSNISGSPTIQMPTGITWSSGRNITITNNSGLVNNFILSLSGTNSIVDSRAISATYKQLNTNTSYIMTCIGNNTWTSRYTDAIYSKTSPVSGVTTNTGSGSLIVFDSASTHSAMNVTLNTGLTPTSAASFNLVCLPGYNTTKYSVSVTPTNQLALLNPLMVSTKTITGFRLEYPLATVLSPTAAYTYDIIVK
jgi:hypothetical protein